METNFQPKDRGAVTASFVTPICAHLVCIGRTRVLEERRR